ncbi:MAG: glycine cleavage system aminomethyltransferase GcvT [Candidatus Hodarchaeota archaeon]
MTLRTQLYTYHRSQGKLTIFSEFEMPLWYQGVKEECEAVRNYVGIFDVSHMGRAFIEGRRAHDFLNYLTPNDVSSLKPFQAHYSVLLNERGGIIDDVVILRIEEQQFLMVFNAGNRLKYLVWLQSNSERFGVGINNISDRSAMIAVQGPNANAVLKRASGNKSLEVSRFRCNFLHIDGIKCIASGTGYTGEEGVEIFILECPLDNTEKALRVWDQILKSGESLGIQACGLAARDILRLEAGMCLYGNDISDSTTPYEARIGFVVKLDKKSDFVGKNVLTRQKAEGPQRVRVGLKVVNGGIPRPGFPILKDGEKIGEVTSGTFSPLLKRGIAMGYIPKADSEPETKAKIDIRGKPIDAIVTKMPFYDVDKYGWRRNKQ